MLVQRAAKYSVTDPAWIVALANFPHSMRLHASEVFEVCFTYYFVSFVFDDIARVDDRDKVVRSANLPLQTLPYLLSCERGRSAGYVDGLSVSAMYDNHDGIMYYKICQHSNFR